MSIVSATSCCAIVRHLAAHAQERGGAVRDPLAAAEQGANAALRARHEAESKR
jgi:hypothetical protein